MYMAVATPSSMRRGSRREMQLEAEGSTVEQLMTASQIDHNLSVDTNGDVNQPARVQFQVSPCSDMSSRVSRSEMARSLARVYEPTLQEKAQQLTKGWTGLCLEVVNVVFSALIFGLYVAELYSPDLVHSATKRVIELLLTTFFIFDLGLHLLIAQDPWRYVFSMEGIIDLLTIIPTILMYFLPHANSQWFFVLRVLRIFRALRVLRLKRFLHFKRHGFNYELTVFIISSVAVILCAAGLYHAIEEAHFLDHGERLEFHDALYFILVTMATIGYGDISPQTPLGQVFVMVLIIAVFTVVPQKAAQLTDLAKQNHSYDKDYTSHKRRGHVVVSGRELTPDAVCDFLDEFYHTSRGNIQLDVVLMSGSPPSSELIRVLASDNYRHRTRYLRGSLANSADQQRARLEEATAVFFLANKLFLRDSAQQDAKTVLQTLAVRNFADARNRHLDIYLQLRSHDHEMEMASRLLSGNTANTSELRAMILSRAAICPGANTLILNLLYSFSQTDQTSTTHMRNTNKRFPWTSGWVDEYMDGMSFQLFPLVFSRRFQHEPYGEVVRNIYEHYRALVIMVRPRRPQRRARQTATTDEDQPEPDVMIAPFERHIREGDVGIVIAKTASVVLHIVNTYGYWNDAHDERIPQTTATRRGLNSSFNSSNGGGGGGGGGGTGASAMLPVRVSIDTLMARPSPRTRLRHQQSASALLNSRSDDVSELSAIPIRIRPQESDEATRAPSSSSSPRGLVIDSPSSTLNPSPIISSIRARRFQDAQALLERDHYITDAPRGLSGHIVIAAGRLWDALSIVASIRQFCRMETHDATTPLPSQLGTPPRWHNTLPTTLLLVEQLPTADDVARIVRDKEEMGDIDNLHDLLQGVLFLRGSPTKVSDMSSVVIERARCVLILPSQATPAIKLKARPTDEEGRASTESLTLSHESLTDFAVIHSLLVAEVVREEIEANPFGFSGSDGHSISPRQRQSSRLSSRHYQHRHRPVDIDTGAVETARGFYHTQLDQGLPTDSIKLRMLERFPDLEPTAFNEGADAIERMLDEYDQSNAHAAAVRAETDDSLLRPPNHEMLDGLNTIGMLYHARSAKFTRPRDPALCHDEHPFLCPAFASGNLFLSSVLDRIICLAFYNPYITDVIRTLAMGDDHEHGGHRHRRLFQVTISTEHLGQPFLTAFHDFLARELLIIAVLRHPTLDLANRRPYVYTCPPPDTVLHEKDRLFVLG